MRGLRKYLTPFAPDQSGAVSVLYELGGIIVICDAGGCTGNRNSRSRVIDCAEI